MRFWISDAHQSSSWEYGKGCHREVVTMKAPIPVSYTHLIQRVTLKCMLASKRRTMVTVFGVILSVAMIAAVSTIAQSFQDLMLRNARSNFGDFEMKSYEELKEIPEYITWIEDKSGQLRAPGGESIRGFAERIAGGFAELRKRHALKELSMKMCIRDRLYSEK